MDKTQIKRDTFLKSTYISTDLSVFFKVKKTLKKTDKSVEISLVVLKKRVLSSFVFSIYCYMNRASTRIECL